MAKTQSKHSGAKSENNKILKVSADFDALIMQADCAKYLTQVPDGARCNTDIAKMMNVCKTTAQNVMNNLVAKGKARMVVVHLSGTRGRKSYIVPV